MKTVLSKEKDFLHIISLIKSAKEKALLSVNTELINLYWEVGKYISKKISNSEWGEGVIDNLAVYISKKNPEVKGFTRRGLFRMRQFYETYSKILYVFLLVNYPIHSPPPYDVLIPQLMSCAITSFCANISG